MRTGIELDKSNFTMTGPHFLVLLIASWSTDLNSAFHITRLSSFSTANNHQGINVLRQRFGVKRNTILSSSESSNHLGGEDDWEKLVDSGTTRDGDDLGFSEDALQTSYFDFLNLNESNDLYHEDTDSASSHYPSVEDMDAIDFTQSETLLNIENIWEDFSSETVELQSDSWAVSGYLEDAKKLIQIAKAKMMQNDHGNTSNHEITAADDELKHTITSPEITPSKGNYLDMLSSSQNEDLLYSTDQSAKNNRPIHPADATGSDYSSLVTGPSGYLNNLSQSSLPEQTTTSQQNMLSPRAETESIKGGRASSTAVPRHESMQSSISSYVGSGPSGYLENLSRQDKSMASSSDKVELTTMFLSSNYLDDLSSRSYERTVNIKQGGYLDNLSKNLRSKTDNFGASYLDTLNINTPPDSSPPIFSSLEEVDNEVVIAVENDCLRKGDEEETEARKDAEYERIMKEELILEEGRIAESALTVVSEEIEKVIAREVEARLAMEKQKLHLKAGKVLSLKYSTYYFM